MFASNSGWLFTDAAESLFVVSIIFTYYYFSLYCYSTFSLCLFSLLSELSQVLNGKTWIAVSSL